MQEFRKDALAEEPWVVRNAAQAAAKNVGKALDALAQGYIYPALGWAFEAGHEWRYARERARRNPTRTLKGIETYCNVPLLRFR